MAKSRKKSSIFRKIILIVVVLILGIAVIVAGIFLGSISKLKKNAEAITAGVTKDTFRQTETSIIYDVYGNEITSISGSKELYYVEDEDIPYILKTAFVTVEDQDFYTHNGIDLLAIIRAYIANMRNETIVQGASTITQQLAKNVFLTNDVTWERKITEMFIAVNLEEKFSKTEILEFYINNIYYGNGYYGIQAAAEGYFNTTVDKLSLSQLVFLAGIPKNPSRFDPVTKYDSAVERRDFILKQLYANGSISGLEYYSAIEEKIELKTADQSYSNYVETFVFYCAARSLMEANGFVFQYEFADDEARENYQELYDQEYTKYQTYLFTGGYRIYTSIDMNKQELLQKIINEKLSGFTETNDEGIYSLQGAGVCIDNNSGFVTAIVGGREQEYDGYTLNRGYQSFRQPGSAIKPLLVYAPYMALGHSPDETIKDEPIPNGPDNVDGKYYGNVTLTQALAMSSNVAAWQLMESMTPEYAMGYLHRMNFKNIDIDDNNIQTAIGGFTYGVTPLEMAAGYAALENGGVYREPTCVMNITDAKGNTIADNYETELAVYDEQTARKVTKMMEYGVNKGLLVNARLDNAIVAAKSGTTNDNKDGWLCGYSRYYTTAVWVGCDMPKTVEGLSGGSYPLDIWKEYMYEIHKGLTKKNFPNYEGTSEEILGGTESETQKPSSETETHPGHGDNILDISDGDDDYDVSGMGDKDAPKK
ncbi:MAG: transglycosylase domain-containing protein [Butyrivibrio sp.]